MKHRCTRRIQFCAGHRVYQHESKCANLHGHNYVAFITCESKDDLDSIGRVIDFSVIKEKVGGFIDDFWDHGMILYREDPLASLYGREFGAAAGMKHYFMDANPTAENMAAHLKMHAQKMLAADGINVTKVRLWETENCYAEI